MESDRSIGDFSEEGLQVGNEITPDIKVYNIRKNK